MNTYPYDIALQQKLRKYGRVLLVIVAIISALVLCGWVFQIPILRRPVVELVAMNPLTAVLFLSYCIALPLLASSSKRMHHWAGGSLAAVILTLALCRLADIFAGADTRVDQLLFPHQIANDLFDNQPNRMAPNTAIGFLFLGIALLLLLVGRSRQKQPAQYALIPVAMIAFLGILGYLYRVSAFYGVLHYIPMAFHSALCLLLSILAMLFLTPERGVMRVFTTTFSGSQIGRYLIPAVILVPALLGYLRLISDWYLHFPVGFGVAMLAIGIIMVLLALVGYSTVMLNAKDALQHETQAKLGQLNRELEKRVEERTAAALKNSARLHSVMENMLEGAQIIDYSWRYLFVNEAVARHARLTKEQLIGRAMTDLFSVSENLALFQTLRICLEQRKSRHIEVRIVFPDSRVGWFELSVQPVIEGLFILSVDITERKEAEDRVHQANSELEKKVAERTAQLQHLNHELESFSYSISHDLRAPLRAVEGYAHMLNERAGAQLDAENSRMLKAIQAGAARMNELIDDILNLSQLDAQQVARRHVDMNKLVAEVLHELLGHEKRVAQLSVDNLPPVEADPGLIRQVFTNLLSNALKYSAKQENPQINITASNADGKIIYSVRDNGVGFDMAYADKLFGVFQRMHKATDYEGTGVGLAIVQRIVHKHGGEVWAEAEPQKGATFYFSLPLSPSS